MTLEAAQQNTIRQYLLGQLSPAELSEFEERLLVDGAFYEELLIEEDELVDQYLCGDLSALEIDFFVNYFLCTPERQQKLAFAGALRKFLAPEPVAQAQPAVTAGDLPAGRGEVPEPSPKWRVFSWLPMRSPIMGFALAAAVLLVVFGVGWLILKNSSQLQPHEIYTAVLIPGQTRSGDPSETKNLNIPRGKDTVRLQLQLLADDYHAYRAVLQDATGAVVLRQELQSQSLNGQPLVQWDVPAGKLAVNYYQIKLAGLTADGKEEKLPSYVFKVGR